MAAVTALAQVRGSVGVAVVAQYAGSDRLQLRYQAAAALGVIGGRDALKLLGQLLDDPNPLVRVAAASSVLKIERG